ncbi:MAG: hypothetical protein HXS52_03985 [Theionarchaea archaeon]|nr:hypothetical protein [Theionarchaea archaeon]
MSREFKKRSPKNTLIIPIDVRFLEIHDPVNASEEIKRLCRSESTPHLILVDSVFLRECRLLSDNEKSERNCIPGLIKSSCFLLGRLIEKSLWKKLSLEVGIVGEKEEEWISSFIREARPLKSDRDIEIAIYNLIREANSPSRTKDGAEDHAQHRGNDDL